MSRTDSASCCAVEPRDASSGGTDEVGAVLGVDGVA